MKIIPVFLLFLFSFLFPDIVRADEKFAVSYDIKYDVKTTGTTVVTQTGYIKNLTSDFYPTVFKSKVNDLKMTKIKGSDRYGALKIKVSDDGDGKLMTVTFNDKSVGLDKTYKWTLTYETPEIAKKSGRIWEITLPRPGNTENIVDYKASLVVPKDFGQAAYLKPKPEKPFVWTGKEIKDTGVFAAFGDYQLYGYRLTYHLTNNYILPSFQDIALIPTTAYQESYLENLDPKPWKIYRDEDGNWLAKYILQPKSSLSVIASGAVSVFLKPRYTENKPSKDTYLDPQAYWETNNTNIVTLAGTLVKPKNIFNFVVKSLKYDTSRLDNEFTRFGAANILNSPDNALCLEFTDLFVAIARASGIPAREIEGYAYANNEKRLPVSLRKDVLHAWPEFYSESESGGNWKMVDPTWQNTTDGIDYYDEFDFNHIVFAIHGISSYLPYPAGSYKDTTDTKDVLISFRSDSPIDVMKIKESKSIILPNDKISILSTTAVIFTVVSGCLFLLFRRRQSFIHRQS